MSAEEFNPSESPPGRRWFQFSLRTLLLLFVVLGSSLAVFELRGIVVFALVVALAVGVQQAKSLSSPSFVIWAAFCLICFLMVMLLPFVNVARENGRRAACLNHVKGIAAALQDYHQQNGHFPPAYIADKDGKPMHSWRVLILRDIEYYSLYKAYDFTQPWDGPKNKTLLTTGLRFYLCPSDPSRDVPGAHRTSYLAVVRSGSGSAAAKQPDLVDSSNDPSHTIMLIEVANSGIDWSEPRDYSVDSLNVSDSKSPPADLASHRVGHRDFSFIYADGAGVHVAMADGSAHFLRTDCLSSDDLRKVLAIGGCKNVAGGPHVALDEEDRRLNWPNIAALTVWLLSVGVLLARAVRNRRRRADSEAMADR